MATTTTSSPPAVPLHLTTSTGRLTLRSPILSDAAALHANSSDPLTIAHLPHLQPSADGIPRPLSATESWLRSTVLAGHGHDNYHCVIVEVSSGEVIGDAGVQYVDLEKKRGYVGVMLRRDRWGKGYGSEVMQRSIELAWEVGCQTVEVGTLRENAGMIGVMRRIGYGDGEERVREDGKGERVWVLQRLA